VASPKADASKDVESQDVYVCHTAGNPTEFTASKGLICVLFASGYYTPKAVPKTDGSDSSCSCAATIGRALYSVPYIDDSATFRQHQEMMSTRKRVYTRLVQAFAALTSSSAVFPVGTPGTMLEPLLKAPLWRDGVQNFADYIRAASNPGESNVPGDQNALLHADLSMVAVGALEPGMHISFSLVAGFGSAPLPPTTVCWFWNDLIVVPYAHNTQGAATCSGSDDASSSSNTGGDSAGIGWVRLEALARVPICMDLLDDKLLSPAERGWIDEYHQAVRTSMLPR
jgi:hypothetical protein